MCDNVKQYLSPDEAAEFVQRIVEALGEHFDAVQVLTSYPATGGGTGGLFGGTGNWFARTGMAHEFLKRDEEQTMAKEVDEEK